MKKLLFVFPIVALLAAACNSKQNITLNNQSNLPVVKSTQSTPTPTPTSAPIYPKPTMQSGGVLVPTKDGQLYTNQDIGIQMVVPTSWTLGKTNNKNSVTFQNKEAARKFYEQNKLALPNPTTTLDDFVSNEIILYIQYFKDLNTYKKFASLLDTTCSSLAKCWESSKGTPDEMEVFGKVGGQTMYTFRGCMEMCEQLYLIQYKGAIYRFDSASYYFINDGSMEKTLKFLN